MIRQRRQQNQRQRISPKLRMTLLSSGFFTLAAFALVIYSNAGMHLNAIAGQGMLGEKIFIPGQTVVNEFTTLTADVRAGSTQINVADNSLNTNTRFAGNLQAGELVMIIQMQNGPKQYIDLNEEKGIVDESGKYEFAEVAGIEDGPKINFTSALKNSYSAGGKTQVVRVPRYNNLTVQKGATITTDSWDGTKGGIVAIEVKGNAVVNGNIDASGAGFNGKAFQKLLRNAADMRKATISGDTLGNRIYFGAASINKTFKTQCSGGGIVFMIVEGTIEGSGIIHADGNSVPDNAEIQANGGQGGSVYVCARQANHGITLSANGGNALQRVDSSEAAAVRGSGGEGGIIRTDRIQSFKCQADGGLNAADSVRAAAGIVHASVINPYSANISSHTKLEYFAAASVNGSVQVSWVTSSEENVDFFTVERSIDGNQFIPVFKINGKGSAGMKSSYQFEDAAQTADDCQYRLIQTTFDNHIETFPAVRIKQSGKVPETKLISVQPNPIADQFTIKCMISEPGVLDIALTDISGNVVRKESAVADEGMNTISVNNLSDIPKGTYFLSMMAGTQKLPTVKILK